MSSGRRRTTDRHYSAEEQALDQISKEAEERIQARRQARAEAREIRLKEIERQQKEEEDKQKAQSQGSDAKSVSSFSGSRRGSNESTESDVSSKDSRDPKDQVRQFKNQLRELEEKYKAAMVTNAQLDNTKTSQVFQLELLKEQLEEQEEGMIEVQREYKDKCREYDLLKRDHESLKLEFDGIKQQIEIKDKLLKESGLVIVTTDEGEFSLTKCSNMSDVPIPELGSSIISEEAADLLKKAGEGTLGNAEVKAESVNKKTDNIESVVENKVNKGSSLVDVDVEVNRKGSGSEDIHVVDGLDKGKLSNNTEDTEDVNNNAENNDNLITGKDTSVEGNVDFVTEESKPENVIVKDDVRDNRKEDKCSESDENEVFYESKSEVSPTGCVDVRGAGEQEVGNEIADLESPQNNQVEMKVESEEKEDIVLEGNKSKDVNAEGQLSESEFIEEKGNDLEGKEVVDIGATEGKLSVSESLDIKPKSGSVSSLKKLVYCASGISLESDVTYHSESDDEFVEETEVKQVNDGSDIENIDVDFEDEKVLMRDKDKFFIPTTEPLKEEFKVDESVNVALGGNVKFGLDNEEICTSNDSVDVKPGADLETKVDVDKPVVGNTDSSKSPKLDVVSEVDHKVNDPKAEVCTSLFHNDEVFMSLPTGQIGNEQSMIEFAKNYVTDIVLKSVDLYNKEVKEEKIMVRQQSCTSANIDISIPKRHYSEELVDTASAVMPRKLSSGGSVEILSPLVHLQSEKSGDLKFFSYKVDTDADVVLTSIEEEKNPLEGMVTIDGMPSPISGFGICYSGVKGHSDIDSDSDDSDDETEDLGAEMGPGIDFISMPVATDNVKDDSKDIQKNESDGEGSKVGNNVETTDVSTEVNVPSVDKSDECVDTSIGNTKTEVDSEQSKDVDKLQDDLVNDSNQLDNEDVEKVNEGGENLSSFYKGIESEVSKMGGGGNGDEVTDNVTDLEENSSSKLDGDINVIPIEGATGGDKDEELHSGANVSKSVDSSPEAGSRLSGEISPNEESGHSVDSNSGKAKKKGSKKRGSKKNSKEECLIS
ncbi:leucine-rich repeat flightless-interacting protein 1-like isoform X1 [Ruditapes philippinarum]|uniref:leucine-rich repeat flightless-interacting protein 1-like isoform X1 n=1 Tax=Ruditapes philippinarum TaxID=129788 RepID=UPI00295AE26E|nr:leucine-rich repeat flightless-interacting protein 1-like isoform X1 [Ruditapes philippinarum]